MTLLTLAGVLFLLTCMACVIGHREADLRRTSKTKRSIVKPRCWRVCLWCWAAARCVRSSACLLSYSPTRRTTLRKNSSKRWQVSKRCKNKLSKCNFLHLIWGKVIKLLFFDKINAKLRIVVLLLIEDVVECLQRVGLQECEDICQLSPVLPGSWVARSKTVWWPLHARLFPLQPAGPWHSQRFL